MFAAPTLNRRRFLVTGVLLPLSAARVAFAGDRDALRAGGVLRIGTSGDYAPFSALQNKGFAGLDIELAARLARDFGVRAELVRFAWPELIRNLKAAKFELAMSGITLRGDRALAGRLSRPYAVTSAVALIRSEDRARYPDAAALNQSAVRLSVNGGGYLESVARLLFPLATIVTTRDNTKLFAPVLAKAADAAISDSAEAHAQRVAGLSSLGPMTHDRKALFIADGAPELAEWVDAWLRDRERDGFLPQLRQRHLGPPQRAALPMTVEAVCGAIQLRCELMPFVGAYKVGHGLPIEDAAQEARVLARMVDVARGAKLEPDGVQALYRALMAAAKDIELARASEPSLLTPTLDELRAVIRGIDGQLLAELRESALGHANSDWLAALERGVTVPGLSGTRKQEIAAALAQVRVASSPAPG